MATQTVSTDPQATLPLGPLASMPLTPQAMADASGGTALQQAIQSALMAKLPAAPATILLCGFATERLQTDLSAQGYQVRQASVVPPARPSIDPYDAMIVRDLGYALDAITLFNQALDWLKPAGELILLDTFATDFDQDPPEPVYLLAEFQQWARRFRFEPEDPRELSTEMLTYCQQLLPYLQRPTQAQWLQYESGLIHALERYRQGRYQYLCLPLRKTHLPKWRLQYLDRRHLDKMLSLFERSFNHRMSKDLWQWKYGNERAKALCVWEQDDLIAHYGGMPRDILFFGQRCQAVQIGDVMVNPAKRGALSRTGPFFRMTATFMEHYTGFGKPFLISFGFPNERHLQVAQYLGLYAGVGHMEQVSWPPLTTRAHLTTTLRVIDPETLTMLAKPIDRLWQRMAQDFRQDIIGVRNAAYLIARYHNHPENAYVMLQVKNRFTRKICGIIVVAIQNEYCDIIDLITPLQEIPLLIQYVRRFAATRQCSQVRCQISNAFVQHFMTQEAQSVPLNIHIACDIRSKGPGPESLNNHWWLLPGDMDCR